MLPELNSSTESYCPGSREELPEGWPISSYIGWLCCAAPSSKSLLATKPCVNHDKCALSGARSCSPVQVACFWPSLTPTLNATFRCCTCLAVNANNCNRTAITLGSSLRKQTSGNFSRVSFSSCLNLIKSMRKSPLLSWSAASSGATLSWHRPAPIGLLLAIMKRSQFRHDSWTKRGVLWSNTWLY